MTTKEIIVEVSFNFTGNDKGCLGKLKAEYDYLKYTIYIKDDRKNKIELMTFNARNFVKKDTNDKLKDPAVEVERIPEKSFYNLLRRSIVEDFKNIMV
ncbi:MAG: hypothetical protein H7199_09905 [Burkholderiales bacterium]|nr:hypothetical protein [Flavobacterium sp.]